jgi:hypothetical protein
MTLEVDAVTTTKENAMTAKKTKKPSIANAAKQATPKMTKTERNDVKGQLAALIAGTPSLNAPPPRPTPPSKPPPSPRPPRRPL